LRSNPETYVYPDCFGLRLYNAETTRALSLPDINQGEEIFKKTLISVFRKANFKI
jgi:hypothetical protein